MNSGTLVLCRLFCQHLVIDNGDTGSQPHSRPSILAILLHNDLAQSLAGTYVRLQDGLSGTDTRAQFISFGGMLGVGVAVAKELGVKDPASSGWVGASYP